MLPDAGRTIPSLGRGTTRKRASVLPVRRTNRPSRLDVGRRDAAACLHVSVQVLLGAVAAGAGRTLELVAIQLVQSRLVRR